MDTQQIIKERLDILPEDIKLAIKNGNLADKFNLIAKNHNLRIDQNGALQTETLLVMIGIEKTDDYIDNIQKNLEVSRDEAISIAKDINGEIFNSIKESLQTIQEENEDETDTIDTNLKQVGVEQEQSTASFTQPPTPEPPPTPPVTQIPTPNSTPVPIPKPPVLNPQPKPISNISSIEKAGQFTIEKPVPNTNQYNEKTPSRDDVLKLIEDPQVSMIDHLLTSPVQTSEKIEIKKPEEIKSIQNQNQDQNQTTQRSIREIPKTEDKKYTADPYREVI